MGSDLTKRIKAKLGEHFLFGWQARGAHESRSDPTPTQLGSGIVQAIADLEEALTLLDGRTASDFHIFGAYKAIVRARDGLSAAAQAQQVAWFLKITPHTR